MFLFFKFQEQDLMFGHKIPVLTSWSVLNIFKKAQDLSGKAQDFKIQKADYTQAFRVIALVPCIPVPCGFKKPSRRNGTALLIVPFKIKSLYNLQRLAHNAAIINLQQWLNYSACNEGFR
jgi:hypothetical protein